MREAVILAAGYGKGLEPLTHTRHKVLSPILNTTLLERHINFLSELGFDRFIIVINYLMNQVADYLRKLSLKYDFDYVLINQGKPLGTGHALLKGVEGVRGEEFLAIYGDIFTSREDISKIVEAGTPAIAVARVTNPRDYGVILTSGGFFKDVIEKPNEPVTDKVNAGIYYFTKEVTKFLENIPLSPRGEYELTDALRPYSNLRGIKVVELNSWIDIGRPWKLLEANKIVLTELKKQIIEGDVEGGVNIKGPVIIEEGAEVHSGTYIIGPAYIGRKVELGPNAYVRPYSVILDRSKVGFNVEVKESIILEGAHVAHQSYVGDSIIGEESNLGAGTILANLRFDNQAVKVWVKGKRVSSGRKKLGAFLGGSVKTGVNVSTYPGIKVGAYSWINPGITVKRDVSPCTHLIDSETSKPLKECPIDLSVWT